MKPEPPRELTRDEERSIHEATVRLSTLQNGLRVVTEQVPHLHSVSVSLCIDAGARDESDDVAGVSHLLEHMVFKGTERRTARQIAEEFDAVGGHLDAFTSKEYTGYCARVLPEHVPLALDILADMLRHPLLDPADLELEKRVILEEHKSLEDTPEEYVHDVFGRTLWPDHPLGRPVIGRPEVIARLARDEVLEYLSQWYVPGRIICAAAGRVDHGALVEEIGKQFGDMPASEAHRELVPPAASRQSTLVHRPTEQAHFCMGTQAPGEHDPDRWTARVLGLILGGGMSSRLFQEIREKRGLCYSIGAEVCSYREAGLFLVYADTSPEYLQEVRDLTRQELLDAARSGVTADELERAKDQFRASTLLSLDDLGSRMTRLARSMLYHGRVIPPSEVLDEVEKVSLDDCRRVADRLFGEGELAFAAIGPFRKKRSTAGARAGRRGAGPG